MADVATRFARDLFDSAVVEGARQSRSAKQQLDHWARVGRAVTARTDAARRRLEAVMAGDLPDTALTGDEATALDAEITAAVEERAAAVNIGQILAARGITYVALDDAGALVEYHPDGTSTPLAKPSDTAQ